MPETPFDPAPMPVAGAFSEPAAIKAHAEMVNQINVLRSDRDTWRRLCREAQAKLARVVEALSELMEREELDLKHAYTTCDMGDSTNADRGCLWCVARAALDAAKGGE